MLINKNDLPSRQFEVEMDGLSALAIIQAKNKKDLLRIVYDSVHDNKEMLTIQDLHFLTTMHRVLVSDVSPLNIIGACSYPVFLIDRAGEQRKSYSLMSVQPDDVVQGTIPCGGHLSTLLAPTDLDTKYLGEIPEEYIEPEFDLPRAAELDFYQPDDRKVWLLMHLKPEFRTPEYLDSKGVDFIAKLVRYCNAAEHGLVNVVAAICPDCGRRTDISYDIDLSSFL